MITVTSYSFISHPSEFPISFIIGDSQLANCQQVMNLLEKECQTNTVNTTYHSPTPITAVYMIMPIRRPPINPPAIAPPSESETCVTVGCSHSTPGGSGLVHAPVVCGVSLVGQVFENWTRLSSTVVEMLSDVRSQVCSMSTSMLAVMLPSSLEYTSELVKTVESPVWEHAREESWRLSAVMLQWQRSWIMVITARLILLVCC